MSRNTGWMRRVIISSVFAGLFLTTTAGSCFSAPPCGGPLDGKDWLLDSTAVFADTFTTSIQGGTETLTWGPRDWENLCVAEDESNNMVRFYVGVTSLDKAPASLTITGVVQPAVFFQPYTVTLTPDPIIADVFKGTIRDIGLAQGSQDGKTGYSFAWVKISFPSLGTTDQDVAYAKTWLEDIHVFPTFWLVKQ